MGLLSASGNAKKVCELRRRVAAAGLSLEVVGVGDVVAYDEPAEDGATFEANALITVDSDELPSWRATVDGVEVARTGEAFGALVRRLSFDGHAPGLSGGRVEGLETVVGPAVQTEPGQHGFWTGARISGPLSFDWK